MSYEDKLLNFVYKLYTKLGENPKQLLRRVKDKSKTWWLNFVLVMLMWYGRLARKMASGL